MAVINPVSFTIQVREMHELEVELKNMKSNKSYGYDGISTNIAKLIAKDLAKYLNN